MLTYHKKKTMQNVIKMFTSTLFLLRTCQKQSVEKVKLEEGIHGDETII